MSIKGEKYTSMKMMKKHEKNESPAMKLKEYGKVQTKPMKPKKKPSVIEPGNKSGKLADAGKIARAVKINRIVKKAGKK